MTNTKYYSLNKIGQRSNLEDSISAIDQNPGIHIVCDGVGGNSFGEVASKQAVTVIYDVFLQRYNAIESHEDFKKVLKEAIDSFKKELEFFISNNSKSENTSTTFTLLVIKKNVRHLAWCGDSRIYIIEDEQLIYKTTDHSLVRELINQGLINEEEAKTHPHKNMITKSLHAKVDFDDIDTAIVPVSFQNSCIAFLCTDGVLELYDDLELLDLFNRKDIDFALAINDKCVNAAKDNYSMILLQEITESQTNSIDFAHSKTKDPQSKTWVWAIISIIGLVIGYFFYQKNNQNETLAQPKSIKNNKTGFITNIDSISKK